MYSARPYSGLAYSSFWLKSGATTTTLSVSAGAFVLTGIAATFRIEESVSAGSFALAGQAATFRESINVANGAFGLTGQAVTFRYEMNVSKGAYLLNGQPVTFSQSGGVKPRNHPFFATPTQLMHR